MEAIKSAQRSTLWNWDMKNLVLLTISGSSCATWFKFWNDQCLSETVLQTNLVEILFAPTYFAEHAPFPNNTQNTLLSSPLLSHFLQPNPDGHPITGDHLFLQLAPLFHTRAHEICIELMGNLVMCLSFFFRSGCVQKNPWCIPNSPNLDVLVRCNIERKSHLCVMHRITHVWGSVKFPHKTPYDGSLFNQITVHIFQQ